MFRKPVLLAIILVFGLALSVYGQSGEVITFKSSVDKNKLPQNDTLTLKIEVSGHLKVSPQIKLPDLKDDFEILSSGQSQSISISSGEKKQTAVFEFVLAPKRAGKITIAAVEIEYSGKPYKTTPIEIEVTPSEQPPQETSGEETLI